MERSIGWAAVVLGPGCPLNAVVRADGAIVVVLVVVVAVVAAAPVAAAVEAIAAVLPMGPMIGKTRLALLSEREGVFVRTAVAAAVFGHGGGGTAAAFGELEIPRQVFRSEAGSSDSHVDCLQSAEERVADGDGSS